MTKLSYKDAKNIISKFERVRVLVLGDLMLDEYIFGRVSRISPEAPVPVLEVESEKLILGGAANVAWNIKALGGQAFLIGVMGRDRARQLLIKELRSKKLPTSGLVEERGRHTTVKTRIVAHHQQMIRVDREHCHDISPASEDKISKILWEQMPRCQALLIEDYNKGLVTSRVLHNALEAAQYYRKIVTVDPKFNHFLEFKGVSLFKPNIQETERALGLSLRTEEDILKAGRQLLDRIEAQAVLITAGDKGMYLFQSPHSSKHIPTVAREVYDVSGAGDTVIATITLALASGASYEEAAIIANHAAGIEVSKFGVAVVSPQELIEALRSW